MPSAPTTILVKIRRRVIRSLDVLEHKTRHLYPLLHGSPHLRPNSLANSKTNERPRLVARAVLARIMAPGGTASTPPIQHGLALARSFTRCLSRRTYGNLQNDSRP
jgi:hypothetical protein